MNQAFQNVFFINFISLCNLLPLFYQTSCLLEFVYCLTQYRTPNYFNGVKETTENPHGIKVNYIVIEIAPLNKITVVQAER